MADDRLAAIQKYLAENPTVKDTPGGIHVHFHNGPVIEDPHPVEQNPGMTVLERYTPYLVLGAMCMVPVGGLALVVILFIPTILALTTLMVGSLLSLAAVFFAVSVLAYTMKQPSSKGKRR